MTKVTLKIESREDSANLEYGKQYQFQILTSPPLPGTTFDIIKVIPYWPDEIITSVVLDAEGYVNVKLKFDRPDGESEDIQVQAVGEWSLWANSNIIPVHLFSSGTQPPTPPTKTCLQEGELDVPYLGLECCPGLHADLNSAWSCVKNEVISEYIIDTQIDLKGTVMIDTARRMLFWQFTSPIVTEFGYGDPSDIPATWINEDGKERVAVIRGDKIWLDTEFDGYHAEIVILKSDATVKTAATGKTTKITAIKETGTNIRQIKTIKNLTGSVKELAGNLVWYITAPGTPRHSIFGIAGDTPATWIDSDGTEQLALIRGNNVYLDQRATGETAELYTTLDKINILTPVTTTATAQIKFPKGLTLPPEGTGGNNMIQINTQKNLEGTVEVLPSGGMKWSITSPRTTTLMIGVAGDEPCTWIDENGNEQVAIIRGDNVYLDTNLSGGYAELYLAMKDITIKSRATGKTTQIAYPKESSSLIIPGMIAAGLGLLYLKKRK